MYLIAVRGNLSQGQHACSEKAKEYLSTTLPMFFWANDGSSESAGLQGRLAASCLIHKLATTHFDDELMFSQPSSA